MKRIIWSIILALMVTPAMAATQWFQGTNTPPLNGTTPINNIDVDSNIYAFTPLDRLLSNYQRGMNLVYASAATITAKAGEITVADSAGTIKMMVKNTSDTAVTWAMIDTGTEAVSTTYYVYAKITTTADTTAGFVISLSATAPTGVTYFKRLGSFYNDASGNITLNGIVNDSVLYTKDLGAPSSKSVSVTYQALTDGFVVVNTQGGSSTEYALGYTDSSSTPTTLVCGTTNPYATEYSSFTMPVKKGDYWKITQSYAIVQTIYWIPIGN